MSFLPRPWYVETSAPSGKDVVVVIDSSGSMDLNNRMAIANEAASTVVGTLGPNDRVSGTNGTK